MSLRAIVARAEHNFQDRTQAANRTSRPCAIDDCSLIVTERQYPPFVHVALCGQTREHRWQQCIKIASCRLWEFYDPEPIPQREGSGSSAFAVAR
jgi:hypothetical protein